MHTYVKAEMAHFSSCFLGYGQQIVVLCPNGTFECSDLGVPTRYVVSKHLSLKQKEGSHDNTVIASTCYNLICPMREQKSLFHNTYSMLHYTFP